MNSSFLTNSSMVTLSFLNEQNAEFEINSSLVPFEFKIARKYNIQNFKFSILNASQLDNVTLSNNQLITIEYIINDLNSSFIFMLKPSKINISYLIVTKYGELPKINKNQTVFDSFDFYCPNSLSSLDNYTIIQFNLKKNYKTIENLTVGIGIRELNQTEEKVYCANNFVNNLSEPPQSESSKILTSDIETLFLIKSCSYLDKQNGIWLTDGLITVDDLNLSCTTCLSYHLTDFSSGLVFVPGRIDFDSVFSNSSFNKNPTIYITLIVFGILFIILFIWCHYMDRKDEKKSKIYMLDDNPIDGNYFYEIIVFSGNRKGAGTNSKVFMSLFGSVNEALNRKLNNDSNKNKVLQRGSADTFILSIEK